MLSVYHVPGLPAPYTVPYSEANPIIITVLQLRKQRHRDLQKLTQ